MDKTSRSTPSTLAEEVRSNLPTTPPTTTADFPTRSAPRRSLTRAGMHPSVTTRSTPSTPAEEVRSKLPTTPRTTTILPGGAVSREAPPWARSAEGVPRRSIVTEQRARSLRTLLAAGSLFLILLGLFCAVHQGEALPHLLLIRILARSGAHSHPRIYIHHHNM